MWDFSISRSFAILAQTFPFIILRILVFFGITLAYIFATGTGAGFGYGLGRIFSSDAEGGIGTAFLGGIFGIAVVSVFLYWIREYILYMVKAAHIAVMVEALDGRPLPAGKSQIGYGREIVTAHFAETNVLFAIDQLVKGVVRAITTLVWSVASLLPIPGLNTLVSFANAVVRVALTFVDELILAYDFRIRSENPWSTAQDALVLYAQNSRTVIKNALWLALIMYALAFLIFLIMLTPAAAILYLFPGGWTGFAFVLAILLAWAFKGAILEPFVIVSLMQVYFRTIEGQVPDPAWRGRLEEISAKFRELGERALAYVRGDPGAVRRPLAATWPGGASSSPAAPPASAIAPHLG